MKTPTGTSEANAPAPKKRTGPLTFISQVRAEARKVTWATRQEVTVSTIMVVIFGGLTLWLHDERFIKWKPTVLYWVFAVVLLGAQLLMNKNLIRMMMKGQVELPDPIWTRLNLAWAAFFAAMGVINLYIAFNFATSTWVNFKLFGFMGLMIAFVVAQTMFLSKYIKDPG